MRTIGLEHPSGDHAAVPAPPSANNLCSSSELVELVTWRSLSIVLPAFNEEPVIAGTVQDCLRTAERFSPKVEVIVVDDGSRDRTGEIIDELAAADPRVVALHHAPNQGYGAALLTGFAAARGDLLFFMDSDGQFDIEDLYLLLRIHQEYPEYVVLGYRERRSDAWPRRLNAWGWKQAVRLVLGLRGIRDVDCAFKLFPTSVVRACGLTSRGALINTELLVKLRRMGVPMTQVPVGHYPRLHGAATGANPRVVARAFKELLRLRLSLHRWRPQIEPPEAAPLDEGVVAAAAPDAERSAGDEAATQDVSMEQSTSPAKRAAASAWTRLLLAGPVRRLGAWIARHATPEWGVAIAASVLSIGFFAWYANQGLIFAFDDAVSHLMIARRVLDSRTPGLAQLGTVWLPLHQILMLPLVWIEPLYRSGLAGAIPSMVAYIIGSVYMFRTSDLIFSSRAAGWVTALAFMLNQNVLYMQSTPMSELPLLGAAIVGVYYILRWTKSFRADDLVKSAAAVAGGTLMRYDAWALALSAVAVVSYVAWRRQGRVAAEAHVLLFGTLAFAGCASWFLYNAVIFGDPLAFFHGSYSSLVQQQHLQTRVGLPTHHHLVLSAQVYIQAAIDTVGGPLIAVASLGLIYFVWRFRFQLSKGPAYVVLVPLVFNVASLYFGTSSLFTPEFRSVGMSGYYNERYGLMMVPAAALFLSSWSLVPRAALCRVLLTLSIGLTMLSSGFNPALGMPYAVRDPIYSGEQQAGVQIGRWLAAHYNGGAVLISYVPDTAPMFYSGLPDQDFITDSNGEQFRHALADPQDSVTWIVISPADGANPIWAALRNRQDWRKYFALVQVIGTAQIYQRIGGT